MWLFSSPFSGTFFNEKWLTENRGCMCGFSSPFSGTFFQYFRFFDYFIIKAENSFRPLSRGLFFNR